MLALEIVFWLCAALIVWTQLGYALALAVLVRLRGARPSAPPREPAGRSPAGAEPIIFPRLMRRCRASR